MVGHFLPQELWIERGEEGSAVARTALERMPGVPVRSFDAGNGWKAGTFDEGKRRLILQRHRGDFLRHCPAGTSGLVCCNYLVLNLASGCPYDCSYCFLQEYLANNPELRVY